MVLIVNALAILDHVTYPGASLQGLSKSHDYTLHWGARNSIDICDILRKLIRFT